MSSYLLGQLSPLRKTASVFSGRESYADRQGPGPGNWFERNLPFREPSLADKLRYYGERGLRHGADAVTNAGRFLKPQSGAEAAALAATLGATGMLGGTAKALSPVGAAAPLLEYYYNNQGQKHSLRDPELQRAAMLAALPLLGKATGDIFGINRDTRQRRF